MSGEVVVRYVYGLRRVTLYEQANDRRTVQAQSCKCVVAYIMIVQERRR
jgi:hypothetical protein